MYFLTRPERAQLQQILIYRTLFRAATANTVVDLLDSCGLSGICAGIVTHTTPVELVLSLCQRLSQAYVTEDGVRRLGLIVLLEYLEPIDPYLSDEDKAFIKQVVAKWKRVRDSDVQSRHDQISELLAQTRQTKSKSPAETVQKRHKVDKGIIVQFDLEALIAEFHRRLGYEGVFSFAVGGPYAVLEHYIIPRILQELKSKTQRPYGPPIPISLYQDDVSTGPDVITHKLAVRQDCRQLRDLLTRDAPVDTVMIVWNHSIPTKDMNHIANIFWDEVNAQIMPLLRNQSRCFVVIWANVGVDPLDADPCVALPMPKQLKTHDLSQWFRGHLRQLALADDDINRYLARLESHHGDLMGTYQEMNYIVQELQGGTVRYG
jgi:hypothetical protein